MIGATHLYLAAFGIVTALIYQLPHLWGASDGPGVVVHDRVMVSNRVCGE